MRNNNLEEFWRFVSSNVFYIRFKGMMVQYCKSGIFPFPTELG